MTTRAEILCDGRVARRAAVLAGACILLAGGCARHRLYEIGDIPDHLLVEPTANVEDVDLSRLANYAVSNELIDRGDVLNVTIVTSFNASGTMTTPVRVGDDGTGDVPLIGEVRLAGLELEDAEQAIAAAGVQSGVFRNPHVTVTMKRQRVNAVTVIGAVEEPGVYELPRGNSSLLAAVVAAGGLSDKAGPDVEIQRPLRRGGSGSLLAPLPDATRTQLTSYSEESEDSPRTFRINLASAAKEGKGGYYLDDGDVVTVRERAPKNIHVMGLVHKPGQYELPLDQDVYLLDALAMAGGRSLQLADNVWIIRRLPGESQPARIRVSVREAKLSDEANLRLAGGDTVSVEETPLTFVVDTLGRFVRVGMSSALPLF